MKRAHLSSVRGGAQMTIRGRDATTRKIVIIRPSIGTTAQMSGRREITSIDLHQFVNGELVRASSIETPA